jgi:hypothetical protein
MNTSHTALMVGAIAVTGCSGGEDGASRPAGSAGMMHQMDSAGRGMGHMAVCWPLEGERLRDF